MFVLCLWVRVHRRQLIGLMNSESNTHLKCSIKIFLETFRTLRQVQVFPCQGQYVQAAAFGGKVFAPPSCTLFFPHVGGCFSCGGFHAALLRAINQGGATERVRARPQPRVPWKVLCVVVSST